MQVFRIEKTSNYTVVSNETLTDLSISNKALGLLVKMLSLPPNWDLSLTGLTKISKDGLAAIRSELSELETAGYITRSRSREEGTGRLKDYDYIVYEVKSLNPVYNETVKKESKGNLQKNNKNASGADENNLPHTKIECCPHTKIECCPHTKIECCPHTKIECSEKTNLQKCDKNASGINTDVLPDAKIECSENSTDFNRSVKVENQSQPTCENRMLSTCGFPHMENPHVGNRIQLSTKELNTKESSTYQSINQIDMIDLSERENFERIIASNISYDEIIEQAKAGETSYGGIEFINLCFDILCEAVCANAPLVLSKKLTVSTDELRQRLMLVNSEHISYVYECLSKIKAEIKNIRAYLLVSLYNAPKTCEVYYDMQVQKDFGY